MKLPIVNKKKAIIWDMDGVISDTQRLHALVESELLARYGIDINPKDMTAKYAGRRTEEVFSELLKEKGAVNYNIDELMREKWERATALLDELEPIPGVINLIKEASTQRIPQSVASASGKKYVNAVLTKLGLISYFEAIITGDDISKGKPDPEIFLKAASAMSVKPNDCVVVEDGRSGMTGAKKAGMLCIGLVYDKADYPADILVNSLTKLKLKDFISC